MSSDKPFDLVALASSARSALAIVAEAADPAAEAETIAKARAARPGVPLYASRVDGHLFLFRPMTRELFERLTTERATPYQIVAECLLFPTEAELLAMLDVRPALQAKFGAEILRISGMDDGCNFRRV